MAKTNKQLQAEYERRRAEEGRTEHGTLVYGAGEKQMFVTGETYQNPIVQQGLKRMGAVLYDTNLPDERWSIVPRNITYWESPQRIARYYHAFRTLPPGSQPPPWANREAIDFAYRQLAAANKGQPWYTWGPLTADDPLRDVMRSMPVPPPEAMPKWEQDYYQKLFERKQKDQSRELDRDSIYRALYMQRPNVKPDGTVLWAGTEDDPEKRAEFASDAWSGLAQLSQFEALQRGQTAQPKAEGIPTYGEWLQMVIDQVPAAELEGLDGEALQAIYRIQTGQAQPGDYEPLAEMPDMIAGVPKEEWERMAWWQKAAAWGIPKLSAAMPGIVGGLIGGGLGGPVGAVIGAAGMIGASKVAQDNPEGVVAKAFTALDWLALQAERSFGLMAQINASVLEPDKYGPVKEIFENLGPAWQAAQLAYNAVAMTETDEQGRKFWSEYQLAKAEPTIHYLPDEFSRGFVAEAGDPVAAYVLTEARRRIMRGDAPEDVIAEIGAQFGWVGEVKDLIGYVLLDPLDMVAPVSSKLVSFSAGKLGNVTAAKAFGETGDLLTGSRLYGQMIRQMPPEEAAAFGSISRWLAGVDETGNLRQYANTKQKFLSFDWAFGLTPAARAREFMNVAENNLAALLADETNPEQMVRFLDAVADMHPGDAVRAAQKSVTIKVGGEDVTVELPRTMQAAEAQPIPLALRDLKGKWHDLLDQWNITRPHAALIAQIAAETGTNPAKLIDDLHNGRVNGDAVLRQYADSLDVRAKAGDEAAAKMLEIMTKEKGRGLTGRQLKEIADNFSGPNGAALTIDQFQAQLHLLLSEGMAQWAVKYWNVKTPPWLIRMSNLIKKAQSAPLLGGNPNYLANNFFTDTATMAWDGLLGFSSAAEEAALVERLGFVPTRLREGHGMIGDTGPTAKDPIGQALRGDDALQAMDDLLGSTRKFQPFVVLTSKLEGLHSRQAVFAGAREYINWFSQPGVGFDHMPDGLRVALEQVRPGLADKIEHAIAGGATKAEIEAMVFTGKERLSVRDVLDREELVMLDKFPGLLDQLDGDLAKATTPTEIRAAFAKAKETFITRLNEQIAQKISRTVGDALIKAKVEGTQGVLDMLDGMMADRTTFWLEHMRKMDEAADVASTLSESERALHWQRVQTEADRAWTAFENIEGAKWLGVFEALGAGQMTDEGIKVMRLMTDQHDNWSAFYATRRQLFDEYNNNIATLPPAKSRTPDQQLQAKAWWDETNQKLNDYYIDAVLEEDRLQTQFDDLFAEQYGRQFAGESGRFAGGAQTWRGAVRDARRKMAAAMAVYRTGSYPQAMLDAWGEVLTAEQMAYLKQINKGQPIYQMLPADRALAQKQFYQKVYHKLIGNQLEASHANMPGGRKPAQEAGAKTAQPPVTKDAEAVSGEVQPSVQEAAQPERRVSTAEERAVWAATHDPMTRLKNRLAFEGDPNNPEQFAGDWNLRLQAAAEAGDPPPVVAVADLRGLHATNTISYAVGDEYIKTMAQAFADEGLEAYRIGGDEFAVIFSDEATAQTAMEAVIKRLENAIIKTPEGEYYGGKAHFGIGSDLTTAADAQTRAKLADPRADEFSRATYSLSRRSETDPAAEGLAVYPEGSSRGLTPPQEAARAQARDQADTARSREHGAGTEDAEAGRALEPGREPSDAELEAAGIENPDDIATALREGDSALIREDGSQILVAEDLERLGDIQRANANRQIAAEYGVATATEAGVPNDRHLLTILNQYGYKVDGLEGIDPAIVREVLERRKQALEAAQPQLQAELDRRIVMHRAETMKRNQEVLQLTSYRKPTRDLAVREVYDYYANKFPNDPGKAKAMAEATMVIWDDWARKFAEEYGLPADEYFRTFIAEHGGSGFGVNLNQEGLAQSNLSDLLWALSEIPLNERNKYREFFNFDHLTAYHVTRAQNVQNIQQNGIRASSSRQSYDRPDAVYFFLDPTEIDIDNLSILGFSEGNYKVLKVSIPVDDVMSKMRWDGLYNATFTTSRSAVQFFGDIPKEWISDFDFKPKPTLQQAPLAVGPKGFFKLIDETMGLIHVFENGDISTMAHEMIHNYTRFFKRPDLDTIEGWLAKEYGIKDLPDGWHVGAEQHQFTTVNGVKMGEKDLLARAYERYLAEGWAPNRKLRAVFDNIKRWMMEIYRSITGSEIDIKISDELRGLFDRIHGDEEFMASLRAEPEPVAPAPVAESVWGRSADVAVAEAPAIEGVKIEAPATRKVATEKPVRFGYTKSQIAYITPLLEEFVNAMPDAVEIKKLPDPTKLANKPVPETPLVIDVPGGGRLTVTTYDGALNIYRGLTGKKMPGWENWKLSSYAKDRPIRMSKNKELNRDFYAAIRLYGTPEEAANTIRRQIAEMTGNEQFDTLKASRVLMELERTIAGGESSIRTAIEDAQHYQENYLFQENPVTDAAVGAPLGTGDHYMDMPLDEAMLMGWMQYLEPALEGAERKLTGEGAFRPTLGEAESVVSPEMKRELRRYIGQTQMQLKDVNLGALRWGESRRDMALLNYNRRTHFDNFLGVLFPYQFWYTRTALNWALRTLSRPGIMADYLRLQNFGQDQVDQPGYPTRLRGKVGIPMPFLPDWMGDGVYIDPMRMIYPFHQMTTPFKMWAEQRNREQKQAEYLVQDWMEAQEIDAEEGQQAIESMTGPIWDRALAQVRAEDNVGATNPMGIGSDREIRNPIDMIFNVMGPSLPLGIGYDVLTGRKEHISQLPVTRLIQNTTALLGIGGERGINIEGPIRRAVGLPEIDRFEDYRIDRELASMVADGLIDHQTAIVAMIERSGEAFTEAQRRVTQVMGTRFFTSSLGLDFFPEGEQEMRLLKEEYDRAWQAYDAGDTEAVTAFWDEHPEYEARRAQFTEDPEARLRMFLQRQIWDQYREMNPAEKRATRERFGEVFEDAFLNKETRSYNSIPVEVMAAWAQAIGGRVPETELAGDAGTTPATGTDSLELPGVDDYYSEREKQFPGIQELWDLEETLGNEQKRRLRKQYPMLDEYSVWRNRYLADHPETIQYVISEDDDLYGLPQDIQGAVFEFRAQRDELFPGVFDVQDHYFAIQGKDEKRAYLAKHPELKRYWSWRRQYAAANVKIAPYILGEESLAQYILGDEGKTLTHPPFLSDAEFEQLPPELLRALAAHIYAGRPLGKGALAEIEAMRRELAPGLDIDSFIEMYLKAAVEE